MLRHWVFQFSLILACSASIAVGMEALPSAHDCRPAPCEAMSPSESEGFQIVISVSEQRLALFCKHDLMAIYPVSTSKFGLGDEYGSYKTPLGLFRVREKIGGALLAGAVIKNRAATGETIRPDAPGRDPIVSRILWLDGMEGQNRNAYDRGIYIHGTAEEMHLGQPVSWGCVRMSSRSVIELFHAVPLGTLVSITTEPLGAVVFAQARQRITIGEARPLTLENAQPVISVNFADITYTALLEYQLSGNRLIFGFPDRLAAPPGMNVAVNVDASLFSTRKHNRQYARH